MKYRKTLATTALIGLMAITGCSRGALPENNEGNYNGERLVSSVTRRADGMANNYNRGTTRGFTRNMNRSHNVNNNRGINNNLGINNNTRGLSQNRYNGVRGDLGYNHTNRYTNNQNVTRNTNRNVTRNANRNNRIGHTFDYNTHTTQPGYGMELNRTRLNDRTHRFASDNILLEDSRNEYAVPVLSIDENEETANNRLEDFFAARRNRHPNRPGEHPHRPGGDHQKPVTLPAPPPDFDNEDNNDNNTPEPTTKPAKVSPNAKRAMK
jgi:hypothetical protein